MKYDYDKSNQAGMKVLFMLFQMIVILIVFGFIYMSLLAIGLAVKEHSVHPAYYIPVVLTLLLYPFLLYRYRQWFNAGRRLYAYSWTLASASILIVLLYLYVDQIVGR
jgi:hypothetical protein